MNIPSEALETIRDAVARPTRGVVGLVDDLLRTCHEYGLLADWTASSWRVRPLDGGRDEVIDQPTRKSAFRAILARVAALCNERNPDSVSPYGGDGTLSLDQPVSAVFQVSFANTQEEKWLRLRPLAAINGSAPAPAATTEPTAEPAPR